MQKQSLVHTFRRYISLRSNRISVLPIVILMPHSACNCRCVMCDIWKGNKNLKQLDESDISGLLVSLKQLDTKRIVMSGGEALLNPNFFRFCELIRKQGIKVTLLSTGMTVERNAARIAELIDELIISIDGDQELHNAIRNIKGAYAALKSGVSAVRKISPSLRITGRCVIQKLNFKRWPQIVLAAKEIGLDQISFLPADVSSQAFNREQAWDAEKQESVLIGKEELPLLKEIIEKLISDFRDEFNSKFIAESPEKIRRIHQYYSAKHGLAEFPDKRCNAPWVSVVVEADGSVRPCFFHDTLGSIKDATLTEIINSDNSIKYRKELDVQKNTTCKQCVCYLNLSPRNRQF